MGSYAVVCQQGSRISWLFWCFDVQLSHISGQISWCTQKYCERAFYAPIDTQYILRGFCCRQDLNFGRLEATLLCLFWLIWAQYNLFFIHNATFIVRTSNKHGLQSRLFPRAKLNWIVPSQPALLPEAAEVTRVHSGKVTLSPSNPLNSNWLLRLNLISLPSNWNYHYFSLHLFIILSGISHQITLSA